MKKKTGLGCGSGKTLPSALMAPVQKRHDRSLLGFDSKATPPSLSAYRPALSALAALGDFARRVRSVAAGGTALRPSVTARVRRAIEDIGGSAASPASRSAALTDCKLLSRLACWPVWSKQSTCAAGSSRYLHLQLGLSRRFRRRSTARSRQPSAPSTRCSVSASVSTCAVSLPSVGRSEPLDRSPPRSGRIQRHRLHRLAGLAHRARCTTPCQQCRVCKTRTLTRQHPHFEKTTPESCDSGGFCEERV